MTSSTFEVGQVHVGVEVNSATLPTRLANALRSAGNSPVVKAEMRNLNKKIAQGIGKVKVDVAPDISIAALRIMKSKIEREVGTISVTAKITEVIEPKVPPRIKVIGNIVGTTGGGGIGGGRGGGADLGAFPILSKTIKGLKGAGSGGFFEGISTALAWLIDIPNVIAKVGGAVGKFFISIGDKLQQLGKVIGVFGKLFSGFGKGLTAVFKSPITAGIALVGVVLLVAKGITLIVPLVSMLAGMFTLLAGVMFNVVAAGAVLGPMIGALGVGLGVAAFAAKDAVGALGLMFKAFSSGDPKDLEAYQKALKNLGKNAQAAVKAAEPLVKSLQGIRKEAEQRFFEGMAAEITKLKPLVDSVKGAIGGIAEVMGNVVDGFIRLGENQIFVASINTLLASTQVIMANLGAAATNFFAGLTNVFALLSPLAEDLSKRIGDIATNFLKLTETEESRQKIVDFFTNAYNIALQVVDIIGTLGSILISVFTQTQGPLGENEGLLAKINRKLDDWKLWVDTHGPTIRQWFDDAKNNIIGVWHEIQNIWNKIKEWNTPANRDAVKDIAKAFGDVLGVVVGIVNALNEVITLIGRVKSAASGGGLNIGAEIRKGITGSGGGSGKPSIRSGTSPASPAPPGMKWQLLPFGGAVLVPKAAGGLVTRPTPALVGEAGPEVIIPLNRPLSRVDPSVRAMAAMLRSEKVGANPTPGAVPSSGRTFNVTQNIQLSQADPQAAAASVVNRLVASGFR